MRDLDRVDRTKIKKVKIFDIKNDFEFWQKQSFEFRLKTLELIREDECVEIWY